MNTRSRKSALYRALSVMAGIVALTLALANPAAAAAVSDEQWTANGGVNGYNCNYTHASLEDGQIGHRVTLNIRIVNRSFGRGPDSPGSFRGCEVTPGGPRYTTHHITWALYKWNSSTGSWNGCKRQDDLVTHDTAEFAINRVFLGLPCGSGYYFLRVQAEHLAEPSWNDWLGGEVETSAVHLS